MPVWHLVVMYLWMSEPDPASTETNQLVVKAHGPMMVNPKMMIVLGPTDRSVLEHLDQRDRGPRPHHAFAIEQVVGPRTVPGCCAS